MCVALMSSPFTILPFHAFGSVETKSFLPFSISIVRSREMNVPNAHKTFIRMAHILCWKTNVVKRNIFIFYIYLCRSVCARVCRIHYISFGLVEWYFIRFLVLAIFKMQVSMQENCSTHCGQCMKCNLVNICVQTLHEICLLWCVHHIHIRIVSECRANFISVDFYVFRFWGRHTLGMMSMWLGIPDNNAIQSNAMLPQSHNSSYVTFYKSPHRFRSTSKFIRPLAHYNRYVSHQSVQRSQF